MRILGIDPGYGITGFDSFVVVLVSDGKQQMIYKHAISTLAPIRTLKAAAPTA